MEANRILKQLVFFSGLLLIAFSGPKSLAETNSNKAKIGLEKPKLVLPKTCSHTADIFRCVKYLRNYDGDTFAADIPDLHPILGTNIRVRIRKIDTAEIEPKKFCRKRSKTDCARIKACEKRFAKTARSYLGRRLSQAKKIEIHKATRGNFFRILGDVVIDGSSVGEEMLSKGLAVRYQKKRRKPDWCQIEAQYIAQQKKKSP